MQDRKLFREMSEPHESREALDKDFEAFWNKVQDARKEHKIENVMVIIETSYDAKDGEVTTMGLSSLGDRQKAEAMCAYAYGSLKAEREESLGRLLKGKS